MPLLNLDHITDGPTKQHLLTLHPKIRQDVVDAVLAVHALNVELRITYGLRTFAEQDALYAKGRTQPGAIVTNAKGGQSYHNYGLALDFCLRHKDGTVSWSMHEDLNKDGIDDWHNVVNMFKSKGFEWGGEWQSIKDNPHFQKLFGLNWHQMLALHDAKKIDGEGYIVF
jgi:peptidoglycan LD-endopeptidase CwlK